MYKALAIGRSTEKLSDKGGRARKLTELQEGAKRGKAMAICMSPTTALN